MNKQFVKDTLERVIKTFAQVFVAQIGVDGMTGVEDVNWIRILSISTVAALVSIMTSIASYNVGTKGTASALRNNE